MQPTDIAICLAQEAVNCTACFQSLPLRRAGISLPQPFTVGKNYRKGGVALVGINPGASADGGRKEARRVALERFVNGDCDALYDYWDALAPDAEAYWNPKYLARIRSLSLRIDELLVGNLALCATAENRYPKAMLRNCWARHTRRFLTYFAPGRVVVMGAEGTVAEFLHEIHVSLPTLKAIRMAHFAHREGWLYEEAECLKVRTFLATGHASDAA